MLGLLLLYFIGKNFAELAGQYDKQKWIYVILGIVSYYAGTFLSGILIGLINPEMVLDDSNNLQLMFIALPFGIGTCALVYFLLKRNWAKKYAINYDEIAEMGNQEPTHKNEE